MRSPALAGSASVLKRVARFCELVSPRVVVQSRQVGYTKQDQEEITSIVTFSRVVLRSGFSFFEMGAKVVSDDSALRKGTFESVAPRRTCCCGIDPG